MATPPRVGDIVLTHEDVPVRRGDAPLPLRVCPAIVVSVEAPGNPESAISAFVISPQRGPSIARRLCYSPEPAHYRWSRREGEGRPAVLPADEENRPTTAG